MNYYGGGVPGAAGNLGGVGAPVSFAGGVSPLVRISGQIDPTSTAVPDISLGGGGNLNNAGAGERFRAMKNQARDMMDGMHTRVLNNSQRGGLFPRGALLGGALVGGVLPGAEAIMQGRPVEGVATIGATTGIAAGANKLIQNSQYLKNPYAKIGAMAVGGLLSGGIGQGVGNLADDAVGAITGKGDSEGAARTKNVKSARNQAEVIRTLSGAAMEAPLQAQIQLGQAYSDQRILEAQRMLPTINRMQDAALVRQQAINASNTQNYMQMGVVATAGKLALGAQEQAGANLRTAMTANPYANSTMQAPSISY
jgi:hypothetical protein